jgi:hypothetical protein
MLKRTNQNCKTNKRMRTIKDVTFGDAIVSLLLIGYTVWLLALLCLITWSYTYFAKYGVMWPFLEQYDLGKTSVCSAILFIGIIVLAKGLDAFLYRERKERE